MRLPDLSPYGISMDLVACHYGESMLVLDRVSDEFAEALEILGFTNSRGVWSISAGAVNAAVVQQLFPDAMQMRELTPRIVAMKSSPHELKTWRMDEIQMLQSIDLRAYGLQTLHIQVVHPDRLISSVQVVINNVSADVATALRRLGFAEMEGQFFRPIVGFDIERCLRMLPDAVEVEAVLVHVTHFDPPPPALRSGRVVLDDPEFLGTPDY
jgi:hypothetical protein